jgi:hypothetical protein
LLDFPEEEGIRRARTMHLMMIRHWGWGRGLAFPNGCWSPCDSTSPVLLMVMNIAATQTIIS